VSYNFPPPPTFATPVDSWEYRLWLSSIKNALDVINNSRFIILETVTSLKARAGAQLTGYAATLGTSAAGDGGGNLYYWSAASTATGDDWLVVTPSSSPAAGRWLQSNILLSFTPTGSGAVVRTVQAKLRELVSSADFNDTRGSRNFGYGTSVFAANTTGEGLTAVGYQALKANTTGDYNTAFGHNALPANTVGFANSAFGEASLSENTDGELNSAFGQGSLASCTTGDNNCAFGVESLHLLTTGGGNSAFGQAALRRATVTTNNSGFGEQALSGCLTGNSNSAFGSGALVLLTTGQGNVAAGYLAGQNVTDGEFNAIFGYRAGDLLTTGDQNTLVGANAGDTLTTGSNVICIGYNAEPSTATVSNEATLGNADITLTRLRGSVVAAQTPAFSATAALQSDVTGDGTSYDVVFATEIFDQGADFDATSTFTAQVTGRYRFSVQLLFGDIGAAHTALTASLVTTARSYVLCYVNAGAVRDSGNNFAFSATVLADMTANDTALVRVNISGGTKVVDISATSGFQGELAC
jgi:hypothetical protein